MTDVEKFDLLKKNALAKYTLYLKTLEDFSFEDKYALEKRMRLLDTYQDALDSNRELRKLINMDK